MVAKITISIPESLLEQIDSRASEHGGTRSGFIQEAAVRYVTQLDEEANRSVRQRKVLEALEGMKAMRDFPLVDSRPSLEILREMRETDDSAPLRGVKPRGGRL
jgi:hypothetical protein